jgi:hypothetical protein
MTHTMQAGFEDKWLEFVAAEVGARGTTAVRELLAARPAADKIRRVEVRAGYLWLFAAALAVWFVAH